MGVRLFHFAFSCISGASSGGGARSEPTFTSPSEASLSSDEFTSQTHLLQIAAQNPLLIGFYNRDGIKGLIFRPFSDHPGLRCSSLTHLINKKKLEISRKPHI